MPAAEARRAVHSAGEASQPLLPGPRVGVCGARPLQATGGGLPLRRTGRCNMRPSRSRSLLRMAGRSGEASSAPRRPPTPERHGLEHCAQRSLSSSAGLPSVWPPLRRAGDPAPAASPAQPAACAGAGAAPHPGLPPRPGVAARAHPAAGAGAGAPKPIHSSLVRKVGLAAAAVPAARRAAPPGPPPAPSPHFPPPPPPLPPRRIQGSLAVKVGLERLLPRRGQLLEGSAGLPGSSPASWIVPFTVVWSGARTGLEFSIQFSLTLKVGLVGLQLPGPAVPDRGVEQGGAGIATAAARCCSAPTYEANKRSRGLRKAAAPRAAAALGEGLELPSALELRLRAEAPVAAPGLAAASGGGAPAALRARPLALLARAPAPAVAMPGQPAGEEDLRRPPPAGVISQALRYHSVTSGSQPGFRAVGTRWSVPSPSTLVGVAAWSDEELRRCRSPTTEPRHTLSIARRRGPWGGGGSPSELA